VTLHRNAVRVGFEFTGGTHKNNKNRTVVLPAFVQPTEGLGAIAARSKNTEPLSRLNGRPLAHKAIDTV
jgi:hypothetical protein